jgi:choline kinase
MEIIIPAAGLSTRFPNMRPKYSLTDYSGQIMLARTIKPFIEKYSITIGILKEHNDKYQIKNLLDFEFNNKINVVIIPEPTKGPADTVAQILSLKSSLLNKEIFIKDCDSFFEHEYMEGNYICVTKFTDNELIRAPAAKSFVIANDQNIIQNIVEKQIISDTFCVGGYKFANGNLFYNAFQELKQTNSEIYVSNVIQYCLANGETFISNVVKNYIDVGTASEWFNFNNKSSIFCDIDGTLVKAQPRNGYHVQPEPLLNNVKILKQLLNDNNEIIFVTSRSENARTHTQKMLDDLGFGQCKLIMGLQNSKRIVINDYNSANPYPRAVAINISRNSDTLEDYIR